MSDGKIEFRIGGIEFTGEGEEKWLASQLDKVLDKAPELLEFTPENGGEDGDTGNGGDYTTPLQTKTNIALPKFLQAKNAAKSQVERFLATAEWLTQRGTQMLKTTDVTKALRESQQSRLGNPSDCLNQNIRKGYCEKDGNHFFVTPDGRKSVG